MSRSRRLTDSALEAKAAELPDRPGVYIFTSRSATDEPPDAPADSVHEPAPAYGLSQPVELYVGKAKNIRKRVKQYFDPKRRDPKTAELVARARDILFIECESETEAFLLENRLIKEDRKSVV